MSYVFLSPCICDGNYGGVQLSGRLASQSLEHINGGLTTIFYRSQSNDTKHAGCTASRMAAAFRSALARGGSQKILIWHLSMLRLLPLVRTGSSKTFLFLHGIEAWRKVSVIEEFLLRRVDVFLTNSAFTWDKFIEANPSYSAAEHITVPLGTGSPETYTSPDEHPSAIVIGRMERNEGYKGHRELIEAWPLVLRQMPDAELWILGTGSLVEDLLQTTNALGLHNRVKFLGRVSDECRSEFIKRARCLLLPSRGEGFGLVYLEAMKCGRPCMVSTEDAGREVVCPPEAGLAVNSSDIRQISQAATRLLSLDDSWRCWSKRAKELYDSRFTAEHFQQRLLDAIAA